MKRMAVALLSMSLAGPVLAAEDLNYFDLKATPAPAAASAPAGSGRPGPTA